jgi:hypothetical protein
MMRLILLLLILALTPACATKLYAVGEAHTLMGNEITYTIDANGVFTIKCEGNCRELEGGKGSRQFYGFLSGVVGAARNAALMAVGVPPVAP